MNMDSELSVKRGDEKQESGVALPTVLLIAFLLMVATIAMLSSAGANSRNVTDALDETKAYYAAESGISAAIHVMRDQKVDYSTAFRWVGREYAGSLDDVGNWLDYNQNCTPHRVTIGFGLNDCSNAYKITVSDPANSRTQITYASYNYLENNDDNQVGFRVATPNPTATPAGQTPDPNATPIPYYPVLCFKEDKVLDPDCSDANRTEITWTPKDPNPGGTTATFISCPSLQTGVLVPCVHSTLGWFEMHRNGTGGIVPKNLQFRINFKLVEDEGFVWGITGKIDCVDDVPDPDPHHPRFDKGCNDDNINDADGYGKIKEIKTTLTRIDGSEIMLCKTESICNKPSATPAPGQKYVKPPVPTIDEKRLYNNRANAACVGSDATAKQNP